MAEIGLVGSLIGIAAVAAQLTRTLYEFGATTSAAREQVQYIARNVGFYSDVLDLLVDQIGHDRPIHSRKAIAMVEKIYDASYDLFDRIKDLIPGHRAFGDQISFLQRIIWNFKKPKVEYLVGQLEQLKSTVQLLVQVLCSARNIRAYREDLGRSTKKKRKKRAEADRQYLRTENVIVEWQRTQERLPLLQEAAEREEVLSIKAGEQPSDIDTSLSLESTHALIKTQQITLDIIQAAASLTVDTDAEKGALVLKNTANWVDQLLDDWTVLSQTPHEQPRDTETLLSEELISEDRSFISKSTQTMPFVQKRYEGHREATETEADPDSDSESAMLVDPDSPLSKVAALASTFHTLWLPKCKEFILNPGTDSETRKREYRKLSETLLTEIMLKADGIDAANGTPAREARKQLVREVSDVLEELDTAARTFYPGKAAKDERSPWDSRTSDDFSFGAAMEMKETARKTREAQRRTEEGVRTAERRNEDEAKERVQTRKKSKQVKGRHTRAYVDDDLDSDSTRERYRTSQKARTNKSSRQTRAYEKDDSDRM